MAEYYVICTNNSVKIQFVDDEKTAQKTASGKTDLTCGLQCDVVASSITGKGLFTQTGSSDIDGA